MAIMIFLNELLPEFEMVKTQILSDSEIPSLDEAFSCVLHIESSQSGSLASLPSSALISKNTNNSRGTSGVANNFQKPSYDVHVRISVMLIGKQI